MHLLFCARKLAEAQGLVPFWRGGNGPKAQAGSTAISGLHSRSPDRWRNTKRKPGQGPCLPTWKQPAATLIASAGFPNTCLPSSGQPWGIASHFTSLFTKRSHSPALQGPWKNIAIKSLQKWLFYFILWGIIIHVPLCFARSICRQKCRPVDLDLALDRCEHNHKLLHYYWFRKVIDCRDMGFPVWSWNDFRVFHIFLFSRKTPRLGSRIYLRFIIILSMKIIQFKLYRKFKMVDHTQLWISDEHRFALILAE